MPGKPNSKIAVIGIDIGKNSFHLVGWMSAGPWFCGRNGRAAKWKPG